MSSQPAANSHHATAAAQHGTAGTGQPANAAKSATGTGKLASVVKSATGAAETGMGKLASVVKSATGSVPPRSGAAHDHSAIDGGMMPTAGAPSAQGQAGGQAGGQASSSAQQMSVAVGRVRRASAEGGAGGSAGGVDGATCGVCDNSEDHGEVMAAVGSASVGADEPAAAGVAAKESGPQSILEDAENEEALAKAEREKIARSSPMYGDVYDENEEMNRRAEIVELKSAGLFARTAGDPTNPLVLYVHDGAHGSSSFMWNGLMTSLSGVKRQKYADEKAKAKVEKAKKHDKAKGTSKAGSAAGRKAAASTSRRKGMSADEAALAAAAGEGGEDAGSGGKADDAGEDEGGDGEEDEEYDDRFASLRGQMSSALLRRQRELTQCVCSLCSGILLRPTRLINCRHVLCELCVERSIVYHRECPVCAAVVGAPEVDKEHDSVMQLRMRQFKEEPKAVQAWRVRRDEAVAERQGATRVLLEYGSIAAGAGERTMATMFLGVLRDQGDGDGALVHRGSEARSFRTKTARQLHQHNFESTHADDAADEAIISSAVVGPPGPPTGGFVGDGAGGDETKMQEQLGVSVGSIVSSVTFDANPAKGDGGDAESDGHVASLSEPNRTNDERVGYALQKAMRVGATCTITVHWSTQIGLPPLEIRHKIGRVPSGRFTRRIVVTLPEPACLPVLRPGASATPVRFEARRDRELSGWVDYLDARSSKAVGNAARVSIGALNAPLNTNPRETVIATAADVAVTRKLVQSPKANAEAVRFIGSIGEAQVLLSVAASLGLQLYNAASARSHQSGAQIGSTSTRRGPRLAGGLEEKDVEDAEAPDAPALEAVSAAAMDVTSHDSEGRSDEMPTGSAATPTAAGDLPPPPPSPPPSPPDTGRGRLLPEHVPDSDRPPSPPQEASESPPPAIVRGRGRSPSPRPRTARAPPPRSARGPRATTGPAGALSAPSTVRESVLSQASRSSIRPHTRTGSMTARGGAITARGGGVSHRSWAPTDKTDLVAGGGCGAMPSMHSLLPTARAKVRAYDGNAPTTPVEDQMPQLRVRRIAAERMAALQASRAAEAAAAAGTESPPAAPRRRRRARSDRHTAGAHGEAGGGGEAAGGGHGGSPAGGGEGRSDLLLRSACSGSDQTVVGLYERMLALVGPHAPAGPRKLFLEELNTVCLTHRTVPSYVHRCTAA